jgi:outer membrane protein OmpA-like peptidoglycan-associated protein
MDLRIGRQDVEGTPWSVLSDLAITIVLVLVVFIVLQFVQTFRERAINAELVKRQDQVKAAIEAATKSEWQVKVDSLAPDRQRITFSTEVLFETCRATLKPEGVQLLQAIGHVLGDESRYFEAVQVEGHTDRRPIRSQGAYCPFPSNWELSSARATRVVTLFSTEGLIANPILSAIGRAEYHPVDSLALDPNRRIELILQYDRAGVLEGLKGGTVGVTDTVPNARGMRDQQVQAIRSLYQAVEAGQMTGELREHFKHRACDGADVTSYRDSTGTLRKLALWGESEHVRAQAQYYYDSGQRLRFSFRWFKADNNTHEETRTYFERGGRVIHRDERRLSGPGYRGGFAQDIQDPERFLRSCAQS